MCETFEPVPNESEQSLESQHSEPVFSEVCSEPVADEVAEPSQNTEECDLPTEAAFSDLFPSVPAEPVPDRAQQLQELQEKIGVSFEDTFLLNLSLTHPSYLSEGEERRIYSNQRMEFLGDAVLGLVVSHYLYQKHPRLTEGQLTKIKAVAVSEPVLLAAARELDLGPYILLGRGEAATGGRARPSILADAFESLVGAVFLAKGLEEAEKFILAHLEGYIEAIEQRRFSPDYKSLLQEYMQGRGRGTPTYRLITSSGPDHNKRFSVEVRIGHNVLGRGSGSSKKEAEQSAAAEALAMAEEEEELALQRMAERRAVMEDVMEDEITAEQDAGETVNEIDTEEMDAEEPVQIIEIIEHEGEQELQGKDGECD
jgi:ribonuclease-3